MAAHGVEKQSAILSHFEIDFVPAQNVSPPQCPQQIETLSYNNRELHSTPLIRTGVF